MTRVGKKTAAPRSASKPKKTAGTRTTKSSKVTSQVKDSAMKVLAGAASGAVAALIPQLEEAAGRGARSAGTAKVSPPPRPSRK